MDLSVATLFDLVRETVVRPKAAARRVLSVRLTMAERWQAMVLVVILSVLLSQLVVILLGGPTDQAMTQLLGNPLFSGLAQTVVLVVVITAVYGVGRALGGQAEFGDTLQLMSWLQFVLVLLQLAQLAVFLLVAPLGGIASILVIGALLWVLTNFVLVLHDFGSLFKVFVMILATAFALAFLLALVLLMLGLAPPTGV